MKLKQSKPIAKVPKKAKLFNLKLLPMDFSRIVCVPLLLIFRMKRLTPTGEKYTQKIKGGAVIAANHTSMADPFLVGTAFWYRRLFFLAAEAVMGGKIRSALLRGAGAIKIDRGATDIEAIKKSVETVKSGQLLSIFPQGEIKKDEQVDDIKSGAVLIALKADVPIIPVHILPSKHFFAQRSVIIGEAIYPKEHISGRFPTAADIEKVSQMLMQQMQNTGVTV